MLSPAAFEFMFELRLRRLPVRRPLRRFALPLMFEFAASPVELAFMPASLMFEFMFDAFEFALPRRRVPRRPLRFAFPVAPAPVVSEGRGEVGVTGDVVLVEVEGVVFVIPNERVRRRLLRVPRRAVAPPLINENACGSPGTLVSVRRSPFLRARKEMTIGGAAGVEEVAAPVGVSPNCIATAV